MPREVKHGRRAFEEASSTALPSASASGPDTGEGARASSAPSLEPPDDRVSHPASGRDAPDERAARAPAGQRSSPAHAVRKPVGARWFAALDPAAEPAAQSPPPAPLLAAPLAMGAGLAFVLLRAGVLRASLTLVLLLAAAILVVRWAVARRASATTPSPGAREARGRGLALHAERLAFLPGRRASRSSFAGAVNGAPAPAARASSARLASAATDGDGAMELLVLGAPFGVTLLASPRRDHIIALLSSASGTFYLGAAFDAPARRAFAPLLDRCFTVVGDDAGMEAIGPDGEPLVLAPDELASLLDALVEHSPSCLDRFVLTDARGTSITLDARQLIIGDRAVDLNAPLEWKPIVFQEAFGQAIAVYQGTWIRQSSTELTLVSLLPALGPAPGAELDAGTLDRAVLRDLRLMQASPEAPPPAEQRVAIDRVFMLPVRSALDRAPRPSQKEHPARA